MPAAPDLAGSALDARYELHALIGEGAFGRVYRGFDRRLGRPVAIKVIKPWWAEDSAWVERFEREARMLARVSDPGIVQIFDIGHAEQGPYYVAELVDGESLAERLRRSPMPVAEAVAVGEQLCRALASAHARGIVHCDVKPANVLLSGDGRVKVGDFGVARLAGGGTSQALSATVAGTPRYMAPEQARGQRTTAATDVYSAGVVLYEMLAGDPPFMHGSAVELGLRHVQDEPPPLADSVAPGLRAIVDRALCKRPDGRYGDAAQMADALLETGLGEPASIAAATPAVEEAAHGVAVNGGGQDDAGSETKALARTRLMARAPLHRHEGATVADPAHAATEQRAPGGVRTHPGARRRRGAIALSCLLVAVAALGVWLAGRGGRGVSRVRVPSVVGRPSTQARSALAQAHLRSRTSFVAGLGATAGSVTHQSPRAGASAHRGATIVLSVAERPRWRTLTTFAGDGNGRSVPFRIEGRRWRVRYSMSYNGACTLLLVCFGPSASVSNLGTGASLEGFDLSSGTAHGHTFESGPGLYGVSVAGGEDSARWSMTVQDYD
jgi:eukaryotic-like serine/threonine-protein kinase